MKNTSPKYLFLLSAPPVLLLAFGLLWPSRPTFRLKQVQIRPAINSLTGKTMKKDVLAVDVITEYSDPSISGRFLREPGFSFNPQFGLYIEDEHGIIYGRRYSPKDTKTYRPFIYKENKIKRFYGIGGSGIEGNPYAITFRIPRYQIPKSAGKLTLKTVLEAGPTGRPPMQLPIAIVVRK